MGKKRRSRSSDSDDVSNKKLIKRIKKLERKLKERDRSRASSRHGRRSPLPRSRSRSLSRSSLTAYTDGRNPRDSESEIVRDNRAGLAPRGEETLSNISGSCSPRETGSIANKDDCLTLYNDEELPDDVLQILGSNPSSTKDTHKIHESLATRWSHIMLHGLDDSEWEKIKTNTVFPSNICFTPPLVNPEIIPILSKQHITRDNSHLDYQSQIGMALNSLGKGLQPLLTDSDGMPTDSKRNLLMNVSEAGRILTNCFQKISNVRRSLIKPLLNKNVKDMVDKAQPSPHLLFGDNLADAIKIAKQLELAGKDLKAPIKYNNSNYKVLQNFYQKKGGERNTQPSSSPNLNRYRPARRFTKEQKRETRPHQGRNPKQTRRRY